MRKMLLTSYLWFLVFFPRLVMLKKEEVQGLFLASSWKRRERPLLGGTGTIQVRFNEFQE